MNDDFAPPPNAATLLPALADSDREQLQSVVTELFQRQAILRDLPGDADLYDWARLRFPWIQELCSLIGFEAILNEDEQLIYALPRERETLRRLRTEWSLVLLALWYDYDRQLRAEGSPVVIAVEAFNESLKDKLGDRQPSPSSLREILAFFASRKLVRMTYEDDFHKSRIEILPTIRFILPFGDIERVAAELEDRVRQENGEEAEDA